MKLALAILLCLAVFVLVVAVYNDGYRDGLQAAADLIDQILKEHETGNVEED